MSYPTSSPSVHVCIISPPGNACCAGCACPRLCAARRIEVPLRHSRSEGGSRNWAPRTCAGGRQKVSIARGRVRIRSVHEPGRADHVKRQRSFVTTRRFKKFESAGRLSVRSLVTVEVEAIEAAPNATPTGRKHAQAGQEREAGGESERQAAHLLLRTSMCPVFLWRKQNLGFFSPGSA